MTMYIYETDTHEMRLLKDFRMGDYIVVNGEEYRVLFYGDGNEFPKIRIMYGNIEKGNLMSLEQRPEVVFMARKREYNERSSA